VESKLGGVDKVDAAAVVHVAGFPLEATHAAFSACCRCGYGRSKCSCDALVDDGI
jgi:hypothetical protein